MTIEYTFRIKGSTTIPERTVLRLAEDPHRTLSPLAKVEGKTKNWDSALSIIHEFERCSPISITLEMIRLDGEYVNNASFEWTTLSKEAKAEIDQAIREDIGELAKTA